MKYLGWLLLILGSLGSFIAFSMDVSVAGIGGRRIVNLGLVSDRQNILFLSLALVIIGVFILIRKKSTKSTSGGYKECLYCAEKIRKGARLCRYCGSPIAPSDDTSNNISPSIESATSKPGSFSGSIARKFEIFVGNWIPRVHRAATCFFDFLIYNKKKFSPFLILMFLLSCSISYYYLYHEDSNFLDGSLVRYIRGATYPVVNNITYVIASAYLIFWSSLVKTEGSAFGFNSIDAEKRYGRFTFSGSSHDLMTTSFLLISSAIFFLFVTGPQGSNFRLVYLLSFFSLFVAGVSYVLRFKFLAFIVASFSVLIISISMYLSESLFYGSIRLENAIQFRASVFYDIRQHVFPIYLTMMFFIVCPWTLNINISGRRLGDLRGNYMVTFFERPFNFAFGSSLFIYSIFDSIWSASRFILTRIMWIF